MPVDPETDDLFELTPEEEELCLECSRISIAQLLDRGLHLFADRADGLVDDLEPSPLQA